MRSVKFDAEKFFECIKYLGEFDSVRQIYYVYRKENDYMLVTLNRNRLDSFNVSFIPERCVKYILMKFKGRVIDRKEVEKEESDVFGSQDERAFKILNTLYVMCVLGKAERVEHLEVRGLRFKVAEDTV